MNTWISGDSSCSRNFTGLLSAVSYCILCLAEAANCTTCLLAPGNELQRSTRVSTVPTNGYTALQVRRDQTSPFWISSGACYCLIQFTFNKQ